MFPGSRLLLPASKNFITLVPKTGRKEGHAVRELLAAEGDCGAEEDRAEGNSGDRQGLPKAVVLEQKKNRWDGRLAAVLLGRGEISMCNRALQGYFT